MGRSTSDAAPPPAPTGPAFVGSPKLPSVGGDHAPITGKLSFSAPTRIDGPLRGEVRSTALIVVGERGSVDGVLRASELLVLGEVRGEIAGVHRLEIGAGGRVYGKVEARSLVVNEGGILEAKCTVGEDSR